MHVIIISIMKTLQKRESEKKEFTSRYSEGSSKNDAKILESVGGVERVALSCEKKIKEYYG